MGRPAWCDGDKLAAGMMKKGPWTPEEDILLVTYVHQHGPSNWISVPSSTGLKRCSKSCRLRWTNYLRPGIKRGSFTHQEDNTIIHLQALLGNKWAAISSYLPHRTDNDIKNYWNTHLKKKKKLKRQLSDHESQSTVSKGQWESRLQVDVTTAKQALTHALSFDNWIPSSPGTSYASTTGNIARLLKGWTKTSTQVHQSKPSCSGTKSTIDLSDTLVEYSNSDHVSRSNDCSDRVKAEKETETTMPLSMIESWLLDDHAKDYFSFDQNPNLLLN